MMKTKYSFLIFFYYLLDMVKDEILKSQLKKVIKYTEILVLKD
jgi:hypothetical protein